MLSIRDFNREEKPMAKAKKKSEVKEKVMTEEEKAFKEEVSTPRSHAAMDVQDIPLMRAAIVRLISFLTPPDQETFFESFPSIKNW